MKTRALTVALFSVLLGGAIYSARLTALTQSSDPAALVCSADGASAASGCAANLRSAYGKIAGIPVSAFAAGLFVFLLIHMALTVFSRERRTPTRFIVPLLFGAVAGVAALYYAGVSIFVLHSMCAYCLALDGLIALTIGIAYLGFRNCHHHGQKYQLLTLKNYAAAGVAILFVLSIGLPSQRGLQLPLEPLKLPTSSENPISVVEFADFECPACKSAGRELERLAAEYPGKLSVQIVNFPLCTDCNPDLARNVHPNACLAAKIGIVMRSRGKFEAYCHEAFAEAGALDETRLNAVVRDLGEDIDEVRAVAASTQTADVLRAELARARSAGVQTTPTLLINGQVSHGTHSIAQLRAALGGKTSMALASLLMPMVVDAPAANQFAAAARGTSAADIFIAQNAAGADSGAGCANAHSAAWFNTAANWGAGATQVGPGSTVHLCGTVSSNLLFQGSGTTGNPITLLFETGAKMSAPTWATPAVSWYNTGAISSQGQSNAYIVVDGGANGLIEATDNGSSPTYHHSDDFAGVYFYNCEHCAIRNLAISNLFVKNTSDSQGGGTGIGVGFGSNNSFNNNTIHDTASGISNDYAPNGTTSNIEVSNNTIYRINWGFSSGDRGDNAILTGLSIHDNNIYDAYMWDDPINNNFHHNGIHIWVTSASSQISGPLIYNNYIHGDFGARETGHIFLDVDGGPIVGPKVFNNLLVVGSTVNTPTNGLITAGTRLGNVPLNQEIYNNTLIGAAGGSAMIVAPGATVKNNVIANVAQFIRIEVGSLAAADNNVYMQNTPSGCDPFAFDGVCSGGGARDFSAWQVACNCDAHGVFSSSISVNSDGTLQAGSPAIGAGANLTGLGIATLDLDKVGVARSASSAWDSGAFQFGSAGGGGGNQPPQITSGPNATPNPAMVGQTVSFNVAAIDPNGDALAYAWTFGDGSSGGGISPTHAYAAAGVFTASVTVSDGHGGSASASAAVTVNNPPPTFNLVVNGGSGSGSYTAGTVVSIVANTPPAGQIFVGWTGAAVANASSLTTSLTMPAANTTVSANYKAAPPQPDALTLTKLTGTAVFSSSGHDKCSVAGSMKLPAGFKPSGVTVTLNVAGAAVSFKLDARGRGKNGVNAFALRVRKGVATFTSTLSNGSFAGVWAAAGIVNATVSNVHLTLPVTLSGIGNGYAGSKAVLYTAHKNRSGIFK